MTYYRRRCQWPLQLKHYRACAWSMSKRCARAWVKSISVPPLLLHIITFEARSVTFRGLLFLQFNATTFEIRSAVNHVTIIRVKKKKSDNDLRMCKIFSSGNGGKQERQCTLLPWQAISVSFSWVCVCKLWCPASKAPAPYYIIICVMSGCTIYDLIKDTSFMKNITYLLHGAESFLSS
jgi:hypothetical protein